MVLLRNHTGLEKIFLTSAAIGRDATVGNLPDGYSALMLVAVRLGWGLEQHSDMKTFGELG